MKSKNFNLISTTLVTLGLWTSACSNDETVKKTPQTKQPSAEIGKAQARTAKSQLAQGTRESSDDDLALHAPVVKKALANKETNIAISSDKSLGLARCEGKDYVKDQTSPSEEDKVCAEPSP